MSLLSSHVSKGMDNYLTLYIQWNTHRSVMFIGTPHATFTLLKLCSRHVNQCDTH